MLFNVCKNCKSCGVMWQIRVMWYDQHAVEIKKQKKNKEIIDRTPADPHDCSKFVTRQG